MKTNSRWTIYRWIYRMLYLFGLILLLTGMMLSLISSPAQAGDPRTVAETATIEPPFDRQPVPKRPVQQKGNPNLSQPKVRIESAGQPAPQEGLSPLSAQIGLPPGTGSVRFLTPDTAICRMGPGTLEATVEVSLPPGVSAILQTSYRIVEPSDLSTDSVFSTTTVENGDTVTISGDWPGVRPGDTVVEIHFGAILLDPTTRNPISDGAGVDFYWYPWNCDLPTTPPTVIVEETSTATPTATATATVPGPTVEVGATATPTVTATATATATVTDIASTDTPTAAPTATATITVEQTATATFTATATDTPPTLAVGDTSTPTITATMTPTLTGCCATRTRTASPPTVEVGETATSTPPPTLTPQGPTAVSPSQIATIAATSAPSATSQFPTPIVIVVTATSGVPVTGEQQATAVLDFEATLTAQAEPLQAPPAGEQALVPVTGADLAHRPLTVASLPFWQRLSTYMGLFMLGIGLVLQGLAKRSE